MQNEKSIVTNDGSHTLFSERYGAYYHSLNGALTESMHIFVNSGFKYLVESCGLVRVLEIGFGTGLNAALTANVAREIKVETHYTSLELFPPSQEQLSNLNYASILPPESSKFWIDILDASWNAEVNINDYFTLQKLNVDFIQWKPTEYFNLVYFDAFAPDDQPEMWTLPQFQKLYNALLPNGVLVTYSSKGIVKQALRDAGFTVTRLVGPPGKRHIIRAIK